ncbi:MAG: response regulator, partial [Terriglobales bacterium]
MARKILLADDSVTAQNMGRKILADAGYDVVTVNNGSAALKRIAELKPDLIVLDVYMPGYSGLEVCQRLKDGAETARIPVLLTVGKLEPFKAEEARRVKADGHIVKPFEASELLTAIVRLEERMGPPQPAASDVSAETGWPSRLSVPSKKKKTKDEEVQDAGVGAAFRDFRREKGKADAGGTSAMKPSPLGQNPDLVPDIPDDVTVEELDALSAFAAKLDGLTPAAEEHNIPHATEHTVPLAVQPVEDPAPAVEPAAAVAEAAFAVEPAAAEATFAVEPAAFTVEGKSDYEIPVEHPVEHPVENPVEGMEPANEGVSFVAVNTAHETQEPAPVDRDDEPMFASAASVVEQAAVEPEAEEAPSDTELTAALRLLTPAGGHEDASTISSHADMPGETTAQAAEGATRWVAEPVALSPEEAAISLEAEMFRTFAAMPVATPETMSEGTPVAMPEVTSEAMPEAPPEMMADTTPEATPATMSAPTSEAEVDAATIASVSAIAAAVEN